MSTNRGTSPNRSLSNRIPINEILKNFRCLVSISVETRTLCYDTIPEEREWRKRLILSLHDKGFSNKKIAEKLNREGIKTPTGVTYSQKLIWVTIKKWKDRDIRMSDVRITLNSVEPVVCGYRETLLGKCN